MSNALGTAKKTVLSSMDFAIRKLPPDVRNAFVSRLSNLFGSGSNWIDQYAQGEPSGADDRLDKTEADFLNAFVASNNVYSVIDFSSGDGAQLSYFTFPQYSRFDISKSSVASAQEAIQSRKNYRVSHLSEYDGERADLTISLNAKKHLTQDSVYVDTLARVFRASDRYVIISNSNAKATTADKDAEHREFISWVKVNQPEFQLVAHFVNPYPPVNDSTIQPFSRIYIFHKQPKWHSLPGQLILSLTSYPPRFGNLRKTIDRLLMQTVTPDRLILWLTESDMKALPDEILQLKGRGLSIEVAPEIGSYKKIIPAVIKYPDAYVITVDDDGIYPLNLVEMLVGSYRSDTEILCCRAHCIQFSETGLPLPYHDWKQRITYEHSGTELFPTTGGGVLYPPHSLAPQAIDQKLFMELAPKADDVWLYWMARLAGTPIRKIPFTYAFRDWPGSFETSLWKDNSRGGNDIQISKMVEYFGFPKA